MQVKSVIAKVVIIVICQFYHNLKNSNNSKCLYSYIDSYMILYIVI